MKCPKCRCEHTLKHAENNTVVCVVCGSRFPLKTPAQPAAPSQPTANVDNETLSDLLSGVKHIDDAPESPQNAETTYSLRSEPKPPFNRPTVSSPPVGDAPFAARVDAGTSKSSTSQTSDAAAQTSSAENRPSLFSWSGRASQREFLGAVGYYLLYSFALGIFLGILFCVLGALSEADSGALRVVAGLGMIVVGLAGAAGSVAVTLFLLAASARRLRDAGLSPYLTLLHFVVSLPLTIFLAVYPGQTGKTVAAAQPQTSEKPRPNATQNAPSSFTSAATSPSTATNDPCNALSFKQFKRLLHWNGRATRREFLIALGYYFGVAFALFALLLVPTIVCIALGDSRNNALQFVGGIGLLAVGGVALLGFALIHWLLLTASAQRLRDAALSPWLTLLHLIVSLPFSVFLAVYVAPDADDASPTAFNDRN